MRKIYIHFVDLKTTLFHLHSDILPLTARVRHVFLHNEYFRQNRVENTYNHCLLEAKLLLMNFWQNLIWARLEVIQFYTCYTVNQYLNRLIKLLLYVLLEHIKQLDLFAMSSLHLNDCKKFQQSFYVLLQNVLHFLLMNPLLIIHVSLNIDYSFLLYLFFLFIFFFFLF